MWRTPSSKRSGAVTPLRLRGPGLELDEPGRERVVGEPQFALGYIPIKSPTQIERKLLDVPCERREVRADRIRQEPPRVIEPPRTAHLRRMHAESFGEVPVVPVVPVVPKAQPRQAAPHARDPRTWGKGSARRTPRPRTPRPRP